MCKQQQQQQQQQTAAAVTCQTARVWTLEEQVSPASHPPQDGVRAGVWHMDAASVAEHACRTRSGLLACAETHLLEAQGSCCRPLPAPWSHERHDYREQAPDGQVCRMRSRRWQMRSRTPWRRPGPRRRRQTGICPPPEEPIRSRAAAQRVRLLNVGFVDLSARLQAALPGHATCLERLSPASFKPTWGGWRGICARQRSPSGVMPRK